MDRRQFNKLVATSVPALIGASFLPAADAKTDARPIKGSENVRALVGKRTLKPGEHIFGGLVNGDPYVPIAAFYHPCHPVASWLWRINHQYNNVVWTDLWGYDFMQVTHREDIGANDGVAPANRLVCMKDKWRNFLIWEPNSHRRKQFCSTILYLQNDWYEMGYYHKARSCQTFKNMPYPANVSRIN